MNAARSRAAALALAALLRTATAPAQAPRPADIPSLPEAGRLLLKVETGWYRPESFVTSEGDEEDFFGHPDFLLGTLRVSYSPLPRCAVGVEIPYRYSRLPVPGSSALTAKGVPGAGVFLDWEPFESAKLRSALRAEYFRSRSPGDDALTISDGSDRYGFDAAVFSARGADAPAWRGAAHAGVRYGAESGGGASGSSESGSPGSGSFVEWEVDLRFGRRIARIGGADLSALALGGYALSTASNQEGLILHDLKARRALGGVVIEADWSKGTSPPRNFALTVERDFAARNSLSGWRLTLSWTGQF